MPPETPFITQKPIVVLMGVAGSGKTTVGQRVAALLDVPFVDADDLHAPESRARMAEGVPLTDADRAPWLARLRARLHAWQQAGTGGVLACSALKAVYRDVLDVGGVAFRHVTAPAGVLRVRLQHRPGHFFPPDLLASQLATLEADPHIPTFDTSQASPEATARAIVQSLRGTGRRP